MKWLVTGGTGFIGKALVASLRARGDTAVVLTREARPEQGGVRYATWTPEHAGAWQKEVDGVDGIVHLAGAGIMDARWSSARKQELRSSRVESTRLLAEGILAAERKPRLWVSASAIGIYGGRMSDSVLDEDAAREHDFLSEICGAWETAADAARSVVRIAHPRIGIVLGRGGGALDEMVRPFRAFVGGPLGSGKQWVSWIHLDDAVAALLFPADHDDFTGPYNVTAPGPVRQVDLAHAIGAAIHRPAIVPAPAAAIRLALGERADAVLKGQRVIPKKLEGAGFSFRHPDLAEALRNLLS